MDAGTVCAGSELDVLHARARSGQRRRRALESRARLGRAPAPVRPAHQPQPERRRGSRARRLLAPAEWSAASRQRVEEAVRIGGAPHEDAETVQVRRQQQRPVEVHGTQGGLPHAHAAVRCGADQRAGRLGADGRRKHASCHGGCGARGRSARRVLDIVRIPSAVLRVVGHFGRHRLAHSYRTGVEEELHRARRRPCRRMVGIRRRAVTCPPARHVHHIFDAEGDAMQWSAVSERDPVCSGSRSKCTLRIDVRECPDASVVRRYGLERGLHES